ncbi:hypothetical protein Lalb_Chr05g0220201 [Lupinus albus]|uniref:Uncharacterized protein n=1 Tax=Lupinus albus TaxID=3870 RepID=A0A6A4QID8_LUPAL|nr:hypothetical protein Lalb_Chr05g0220201 [Lupinus albus]
MNTLSPIVALPTFLKIHHHSSASLLCAQTTLLQRPTQLSIQEKSVDRHEFDP